MKEHDGPYSQEWDENNKTETYSCFSVNLDGLVTKKEKRLKVTKHNFEHCHFVSALSLIP